MKILSYANFWHKNFNARNINAFTLAEMMVVLLIMSIILAAMAPVMTTKMRSDNSQSSPWRWAGLDSIDAYFGVKDTQSAMLGQSTKAATDSGKLIINTPNTSTPAISFKLNGTKTADMYLGSNGMMLGSFASGLSTIGSNTTALGKNVNPGSDYGVLIGNSAKALKKGGVVIGYNASLGATSGDSTTGDYSVVLGYSAKSGGDYGISIGYMAGSNTTAKNNIAIGNQALYHNTLGEQNTAIGHMALVNNTSGVDNTILGVWAGLHNTTGNSNTFIGKQAGRGNTTGIDNVAIGLDALFDNATGSKNTAVGAAALINAYQYDVSGPTNVSNNTALGFGACAGVTGSNKTCIGANSGPESGSTEASDASDIVYLGNSNSTVYIKGNLRVDGDVELSTNTGNIRLRTHHMETGALMTDMYPLYDNDGYYKRHGSRAGGPYLPSDRRLKYVGTESTSGLDKIRQLKVFNYTYKKDDKKVPHVGVIAQDLQKVFPNAVKKGSDGFLTIRKEDMFYALINAVKELDAKITALTEQIKRHTEALAEVSRNQKQLKQAQDEELKILRSTQNDINALRKENQELKKRLDKLERR